MKDKRPLIFIGGTTASGKSECAVELALRIGGEVVSCDSAQVYRHMDIGTAKITRDEMKGVPHHMIDVADPREAMSAARYKEMAVPAIEGIYERGKIPVVVGGTPFYAQGLIYDIDFGAGGPADNGNSGGFPGAETGSADGSVSTEAGRAGEACPGETGYLQEMDSDSLYGLLSRVDPESAEVIHKNNRKRVLRALQYYYETGERISLHNREQRENTSPYDLSYYAIVPDRALIYERTDKRVDRMIEEGLEEEVRGLLNMGCTPDMVSMQAIGYRQMISHILGNKSLNDTAEEIKTATRHFAKRQITWLNREKDAVRVSSGEDILERYR